MRIAANARIPRAARSSAPLERSASTTQASKGPTAKSTPYLLVTESTNIVRPHASAAIGIHRWRATPARREYHAAHSDAGASAATRSDTGKGRQNTFGSNSGATNNPSNSALSDVPL